MVALPNDDPIPCVAALPATIVGRRDCPDVNQQLQLIDAGIRYGITAATATKSVSATV